MRWRQPPIAQGVVECADVRKFHVDVWYDPEEPGLSGARVHLDPPESVTDIVVRFRALDPGDLKRSRDERPAPLEMGMLTDVLGQAVEGLPDVRWTIVLDEAEIKPDWLGLTEGEDMGRSVVEYVERGLEKKGDVGGIKGFSIRTDGRDP